MLVGFVTGLRKTGGRLATDLGTGQLKPQGISNSTPNKYKAYLNTVLLWQRDPWFDDSEWPSLLKSDALANRNAPPNPQTRTPAVEHFEF